MSKYHELQVVDEVRVEKREEEEGIVREREGLPIFFFKSIFFNEGIFVKSLSEWRQVLLTYCANKPMCGSLSRK